MKVKNNDQRTATVKPASAQESPQLVGSVETIPVVVDGNILKERDTYLKIAVMLKSRGEGYINLIGAVNVCEGYVWKGLKASYGNTKEGKATFDTLVESTGLQRRMVSRYIQLADKLIALRKLDARTQVLLEAAIEQKGEIPIEVIEKVADKLGRGKTMTDLMREVGILPKLETSAKNKSKVAFEGRMSVLLSQIEGRSKQVTTLVEELKAVSTDSHLLGVVKTQGDEWVSKLDSVMLELRNSLDRIQIASIAKYVDPSITRERLDEMERIKSGEIASQSIEPAQV